jgi:hypothetical protein
MAITMRKPSRIKDEDIHLPMLQFSDFNTRTLVTSTIFLRDSPLMTEGTIKVMLVDMFISALKLFLIIGRVMDHLYFLQNFNGSTSDFSILYFPKKQDLNPDDVYRLQKELSDWLAKLNAYCYVDYQDGDIDHTTRGVLRLHRTILSMTHLVAQEAIYGPQLLMSSRYADGQSTDTQNRARELASKMSELLQSLRDQKLVQFLPPLAVYCICSVMPFLLFDVKSGGKSQSESRQTGAQFHNCMRTLLVLRETWPIANGACFALGQMIRSRRIPKSYRTLRMLSDPTTSNEAPMKDWDGMEEGPRDSHADTLLQETDTNISLDDYSTVLPTIDYGQAINDFNAGVFTPYAWLQPTSWNMSGYDIYDLNYQPGVRL